MARARNIKPGFFRNADLVELPVETRMLFIGLWTLADREGRLEDRPKQIKMEIYPADSFDVGSMLDQLHAAGFINRYEVGSSKFIEVQNFIKHQDPHYKEKASEIPPPPGKENFMKATGVTRTQRQRILDRDGHACTACGATEALCMDHVLPISRGGDSSDGNLQVLCSACNTKKGNKIDGEDKNSRQRRVNVGSNSIQRNDASPSEPGFLNPDSLIPDSLIPDSLIPDSLTAHASVIDASEENQRVSHQGAICMVIKSEGINPVNPQHPELLALIDQGADVGCFAAAAKVAAKKGKGFAYVLGMVKGQMADAANLANAPPLGAKPAQIESFKERDAREGRKRWEQMTGEVHPENMQKTSLNVIDITPKFLETAQ